VRSKAIFAVAQGISKSLIQSKEPLLFIAVKSRLQHLQVTHIPTLIQRVLKNPICLQAMLGDDYVRRISSTTRWLRPNDPKGRQARCG
jgi:hypothetical protein